MAKPEQVLKRIEQLNSQDETLRSQAQLEIKAMGIDAIPYLNQARGQPKRYPYVEIFRMLAVIGDDLYADAGAQNIVKSIINTMEFGAKSILKSTPEEVKEIAVQALTRWGLEVPKPHQPKTVYCHQCNRPNSKITVVNCFLMDCQKPVCKDHAFIIEGGYRGTWFCSDEHRQYALNNPIILL